MSLTLGKTELDADVTPCPDCGKAHFTLQAVCHPDAAVTVEYDRPLGVLFLYCSACEKEVVRVKVAP